MNKNNDIYYHKTLKMPQLPSVFKKIPKIHFVKRINEHEAFVKKLFVAHKVIELRAQEWPKILQKQICNQQYQLFEEQLKQEYKYLSDYVMKIDQKMIGRLVLDFQKTHIYFPYMAIIPEMQKQGIGKSIMQNLLAYSRNKGLPIYIKVAHDNHAIQLYPRLGFNVIDKNELTTLMIYNQINEHEIHVQL